MFLYILAELKKKTIRLHYNYQGITCLISLKSDHKLYGHNFNQI